MGAGASPLSGWTRAALSVALACLLAAAAGAGTARAADPGSYDVMRPAAKDRALARADAGRSFRARAGRFALLAVDPATATPRAIGRLDGFLTGKSNAAGRDVALGYVRARPELFGLDAGDLAALELVRHYTAGGIEQLTWAQTYEGVPAIDTSLTANLTEDGRLINLLGGPRPDLAVPSIEPAVGAAAAYASAARALEGRSSRPTGREAGPERTTGFANGGSATLVIYEGRVAPRLGWRLLVHVDDLHVYDAVVDATTGTLVRHQNLVSDATAWVYKNHPGAAVGGGESVNLDPYLDAGTTRLFGPTAHTFSDAGDTVLVNPYAVPTGANNGEVFSTGGNWNYSLAAYTPATCGAARPCSWDPFTAFSWQANRRPDAVTLHWLIGNFHDHLENTPEIEFTGAAGNFEGVDRVVAQNIDGANTDDGWPDENHFNNANMTTYPDGESPHMQMYLTVDFDDFVGRSTALDASVVYHEYTHGLVGRTIVDAGGFQAVGGAQSGAINEGTADWYALDYLVGAGLEADAAGPDIMGGKYSFGQLRRQFMDCLVSSSAAQCPNPSGAGGGNAGAGGFTYGDFGKVEAGPEVHGDGEIWAQTMWQLRQALIAAHGATGGVQHARQLLTNGMRLAPDNPSFLDLRNAILQADTAGALGDAATIWTVFAQRGMGYFASTRDSGDTQPVQNFSPPPAPGGPTGTLAGTITDADELTPAAGVKVAFAGHDSGVGPELSAVTDGTGTYSIPDVPAGTYPLVRVRGGGYEAIELANVVVSTGTNTRDFSLRRNLASASGGATISDFTGADNSIFGCGPSGLIDDSQAVVWGSSIPGNPQDPADPKQITIALPAPSDVGTVEIDPGAGCGDDDSASLGAYELQFSTDGTTFTKVAEGTFKAIDNHRYNAVSIGGVHVNVTHVRLVAKGSQSDAGSGAEFMDVAEVRVFGGVATPPDATTQSASAVGQSAATLNGLINPQGFETDYQFEYGKTAAYGSKAPAISASAGNGTGDVPVQTSLSNLLGSTTYHYRVVAIRGLTRFEGADQTFTTQPDTIRPIVGLSVPFQRLGAVRRYGLKVKVTRSEQGTLKLRLVVSRDTARKLGLGRTRVIGSLTKAVTFGSSTLTVKLTTKARAALRTRRSVSFTVNATLTDAASLKGTKSKTVTIRK